MIAFGYTLTDFYLYDLFKTFYSALIYRQKCIWFIIDRKGKVMFPQATVSHYVHNRRQGYSVTAHPCYEAVGTRPTGMFSCFNVLFIITA